MYPQHKAIGYSSSGVYGTRKDTTVLLMADSLWIGALPFTQTYVRSSHSRSNLLGNRFLEAYQLTIDWMNKTILLLPRPAYEAPPHNSYGINVRYQKDRLIISYVILGSEAMQKGLEAEDWVLEINGMDTRQMELETYCNAAFEKRFFPKGGVLKLKVQKKDSGQILEVELEQFILFEK